MVAEVSVSSCNSVEAFLIIYSIYLHFFSLFAFLLFIVSEADFKPLSVDLFLLYVEFDSGSRSSFSEYPPEIALKFSFKEVRISPNDELCIVFSLSGGVNFAFIVSNGFLGRSGRSLAILSLIMRCLSS